MQNKMEKLSLLITISVLLVVSGCAAFKTDQKIKEPVVINLNKAGDAGSVLANFKKENIVGNLRYKEINSQTGTQRLFAEAVFFEPASKNPMFSGNNEKINFVSVGPEIMFFEREAVVEPQATEKPAEGENTAKLMVTPNNTTVDSSTHAGTVATEVDAATRSDSGDGANSERDENSGDTNNNEERETGTVILTLNFTDETKLAEVNKFHVEITLGAGTETLIKDFEKATDKTLTLEKVEAGEGKVITVTALKGEELIYTGTSTETIQAGENKIKIEMVAANPPAPVFGNLAVTLEWPEDKLVETVVGVSVAVTGEGIKDPMTGEFEKDAEIKIEKIPAGKDRKVVVTAVDKDKKPLLNGEATLEIKEGDNKVPVKMAKPSVPAPKFQVVMGSETQVKQFENDKKGVIFYTTPAKSVNMLPNIRRKNCETCQNIMKVVENDSPVPAFEKDFNGKVTPVKFTGDAVKGGFNLVNGQPLKLAWEKGANPGAIIVIIVEIREEIKGKTVTTGLLKISAKDTGAFELGAEEFAKLPDGEGIASINRIVTDSIDAKGDGSCWINYEASSEIVMSAKKGDEEKEKK